MADSGSVCGCHRRVVFVRAGCGVGGARRNGESGGAQYDWQNIFRFARHRFAAGFNLLRRAQRACDQTHESRSRAIGQTMPQYRWLDINDRATAVFSWVWSAWSQQKMDLTKHHTTSWYWQNQQLQLDEWARNGLTNVCRLIKIETVTPLFVQHNAENGGEGSRVVLDIKARVVDYLEDAQGNVVQGDKTEGDLDTVWTLVWNDGDWKLNKIEDGANELTYLFAPNEVPQAVGQKVAV